MCLACGSGWRVDPRLVQVQLEVHLPAGAVRSRPFVSDGPLRRGSFALGTGRSPRRKPHVPCMWKRLAGRPTKSDSYLLTGYSQSVSPAGFDGTLQASESSTL